MKAKIWYGDKPNRKCSDCGERTDWDERLRLGLVPVGGPTHQDGITPLYDPAGHYGNTPEGVAEQAKLEAHHQRFHQGGLIATKRLGAWTLQVHRYCTGPAASRAFLKARRPFYGILSSVAPNGQRVNTVIEGCRTPEEVELFVAQSA